MGVVLTNCFFEDNCPDGRSYKGMAVIRLNALNGKPLYHEATDTTFPHGKTWEAKIVDGCWTSCELPCNSEFGSASFYEIVELVNGREIDRHREQFDCDNKSYPNPLPIRDAGKPYPCNESEDMKHYTQQGTPYPPPCSCPPASHECCPNEEQPSDACELEVESTESVNLSLSDNVLKADLRVDPASPAAVTVTENGLSVACCEDHSQSFDGIKSIVDNGDGSFSFTDSDGVSTTINFCCDDVATTIVPDGNTPGVYIYTNEAGTEFTIDTSLGQGNSAPNSYQISQSGELVRLLGSDGSETSVNVCDIVDAFCPETVTSLSLTDTGFTYSNEVGQSTTVNFPAQLTIVDNGDGTYLFTSPDGTTITIDASGANGGGGVPDGNTTYVLTEAINDGFITLFDSDGNESSVDVCKLIADHCPPASEVVTTLQDLGGGDFLYTSEDGTQTSFSVAGDSGGGGGVPVTYSLNSVGNSIIQLVSSDGTISDSIDICSIVEGNCSDALVDNGNGSFTHTGLNNLQTTIDVCQAMVQGGCVPTLTLGNGGNGVYTFDNGYGDVITFAPSVFYSLIDNGDGSISLAGSDGTEDQIFLDGAGGGNAPGDNYAYVLYDSSVHIPGSVAAGTGTTLDPIQIPVGGGAGCDCCEHIHIYSTCDSAPIALDDSDLVALCPDEPACNVTTVAAGANGWGSSMDGTYPGPISTQMSLSHNVNSASDCILVLNIVAEQNLSWPWDTVAFPDGPETNASSSGQTGVWTKAFEDLFYDKNGLDGNAIHQVWWTPVTAAGTIDVDILPNFDTTDVSVYPRVAVYNMIEVCGVDTTSPFAEIGVKNLDTPNIDIGETVEVSTQLAQGSNCFAHVFTGAANVPQPINTSGEATVDSDSGYSENGAGLDAVSTQQGESGGNTLGAYIDEYPAGTVIASGDYFTNAAAALGYDNMVSSIIVSYNSADSSASSILPGSECCLFSTNNSCGDANINWLVNGQEVILSAGPGSAFSVTLQINGVPETTLGVYNQNGTESKTVSFPGFTHSGTWENIIPPGGFGIYCMELVFTCHSYVSDPNNAVIIYPQTLRSSLDHVS